MTGIANRSEIEASLRRAARTALSGSRVERSGRSGSGPADIAMRIRNELCIATLNWAMVETFNNRFDAFRDQLIAQDAWDPAVFATRALVRDVIMTLFRVSDDKGDDRETFVALVAAFNGKSAAEIAMATGADETAVDIGLKFLRERVPRGWGKNEPPPSCTKLRDTRLALRPVRDSLIAHAMNFSSLELRSDVPKTRDFLRLASELSDATCMICNVPRDDLQERWNIALAQSTNFWEIVHKGVVQLMDDRVS